MVIGLRNPGSDYEGTRHNVGAEVVAEVARRAGATLKRGRSRLRVQLAQVGTGPGAVLLAVPNTYMNESGSAVRATAGYYGIPPSNLLVVHDDIDLPFGRLRLQVGGGSGGHRGVASVETALGTNEFQRLKVGVGRPPGSLDPTDYVLARFTKSEQDDVEMIVQDAAGVVELWTVDPARAQEMAALRGRE